MVQETSLEYSEIVYAQGPRTLRKDKVNHLLITNSTLLTLLDIRSNAIFNWVSVGHSLSNVVPDFRHCRQIQSKVISNVFS